jgi:hypothetical protein
MESGDLKVKHHVILLTDSLAIPETFITEEYNAGSSDDNEIPFPVLSELWRKLSLREIKEQLSIEGFIKREFCPLTENVELDPDLVKEISGSASLVEIVLTGTAIISMFFFKANGLPKYQKVFELQLPEE